MTAGVWLAVLHATGAKSKAGEPARNSSDPLALLEAHCVKCHGGEKTKGGLDITTREALLRGGESGAAVVPGKPDASLMIRQVRHDEDPHMPHKEPKLPDAAISQLAEWVKAGVPYTRALAKAPPSIANKGAAKFTISDADRNHWAFQPIRRPTLPKVRAERSETAAGEGAANQKSEIRNPIDQFILAQLEAAGLSLSPPAGRTALIRRVTLDLIGLPPTPAEIDAFVNDTSPHAYEKLLDRLLASPHYGERWGRHWLDLARFAETDGFEHDAVRPHSWRYRDYVIKSFNDDKPYDRFIREQIAGDELWPGDAGALTATGFNLLGPDMVDSSDQVQRRHNTLNDMTDTAALAFLGITVGCARCHDHKFEPVSQRDYYAMQAFFTPAKIVRDTPIPTPAEQAAYEAAMHIYREHPTVRELAAIEDPLREKLRQKKIAKLSPEAQSAHRTSPEQRTAEQANFVLETEPMVTVRDSELAPFRMSPPSRHEQLRNEVKKIPKPPELPKAMTLARSDASAKTFVLNRGEYSQPQEEVAPGFPEVLNVEQAFSLSSARNRTANGETQSPGAGSKPAPLSRAALADWIASAKNPLTARVMVNRIWQHHFGRGLVATPSDFGTHGAKPTHPELLDWLASEFIARGWSVKQMHRVMLMSAAYRQGAVLSPQSSVLSGDRADTQRGIETLSTDALSTEHYSSGLRTDPQNHLLWRMNRLRLEGEVIRDSLLAISGQLNPEVGGPGIYPPVPKEVFAGAKGGWPQNDHARDWSRRSIYIFARRNLRFPFLEVFDVPDNNLSCPARERSTTAPQSLTLLNADEVTSAAKLTEARLMKEAGSSDARITLAYRLVLGRPPVAKERELARTFLAQSPLTEFCRALFNLNDFVYAE